jgi:hypothetical protein
VANYLSQLDTRLAQPKQCAIEMISRNAYNTNSRSRERSQEASPNRTVKHSQVGLRKLLSISHSKNKLLPNSTSFKKSGTIDKQFSRYKNI